MVVFAEALDSLSSGAHEAEAQGSGVDDTTLVRRVGGPGHDPPENPADKPDMVAAI